MLADDAIALLAEGQDRGLIHLDDDPAALAHANAGVVGNYVMLYSDALYRDDVPALDVEDLAHAAPRYVVRAVARDRGAAASATFGNVVQEVMLWCHVVHNIAVVGRAARQVSAGISRRRGGRGRP